MSVVQAVERDLKRIRELAPDLADSTEAAAALELAGQLDDCENSATSKSMCARALTELMGQLRAAMPERKESDSLDDLAARRAKRVARRPAAKAAVPS